jgi:elongator complex protein 4
MAFRKRNVGISRQATGSESQTPSQSHSRIQVHGVRPSPADGRPTTSTGVQSLDAILAGHSGLALGTSLLLEENGTTDFVGVLLRYYAAEGLVQGHHLHIVGEQEQWIRNLPGMIGSNYGTAAEGDVAPSATEKMKIAWRYEKLGKVDPSSRGG